MVWKLLAAAAAAAAVSVVAVSVAMPAGGSSDAVPASERGCCALAVAVCSSEPCPAEEVSACPAAGCCEARADALAACGGGTTAVNLKAGARIGCCSEE
ncbi:MAG: hypothetical protein U0871_15960 [Gemmataceae bacterium]